jgi:prepilin-type N-terminal cleavage/methylation domain-containing protein
MDHILASKRKLGDFYGFTLMEIVIASIILGVITAMALPSYRRLAEQERCYNSQMNLITIHQASQIFRIKNKSIAPTGTDLAAINDNFNINISDPNFTYRLSGDWNNPGASQVLAVRNPPGPSYTTSVLLLQNLNAGNPTIPAGEFPYCRGKKVIN